MVARRRVRIWADGEAFRVRRESMGFRQDNIPGVSRRTVLNIENGKTLGINPGTWEKLRKALRIKREEEGTFKRGAAGFRLGDAQEIGN